MKLVGLRQTLPRCSTLTTTSALSLSLNRINQGNHRFKRPISQSAAEAPDYVKPVTVVSSEVTTVKRPLYNVGTGHLLRSLLLGYCFASPRLLKISLKLMKWIINSKSPFLNPDRNIILRSAIRRLIYDHFCAGTTPVEVKQKVAEIKNVGFSGVILGFSREIVVDDYEGKDGIKGSNHIEQKCVEEWLQANLDTLNLIGPGDFMNIKYV